MSLSGPIPSFLGKVAIATQSTSGLRSKIRYMQPSNKPSIAVKKCIVEGNVVKSIHGQAVALPTASVSSCEVIVAMDCEGSGKFTVLSSPASAVTEVGAALDANTRAIKAILPGVNVIVASMGGAIVCFVNGKKMGITSVPVIASTESGFKFNFLTHFLIEFDDSTRDKSSTFLSQ